MIAISRRALLGVAVLLSGVACSTVSTKSDKAASADWGRYQSYRWLEPARGQEGQSSSFVRRVVDVELQQLGYTLARPGEKADLLIGEHVSTSSELGVRQVNDYYGISKNAAGFSEVDFVVPGSSQAYQFERGQVILDVADAQSQELIWRGVGEGKVLERASLDRREARIERAVQNLVRKIPSAN